jgi:hypothetical protein
MAPVMIHKKNLVLVCRFCHYNLSLQSTMVLPALDPQASPITCLVCPHCRRIFDPDCKQDYDYEGIAVFALRLPTKKGSKKIA